MEPCIPAARTLVSRTRGLEAKEIFSPSGRGRKMPLTSPLIDQAIAQVCAVYSPLTVNECNRDVTPIDVIPFACHGRTGLRTAQLEGQVVVANRLLGNLRARRF